MTPVDAVNRVSVEGIDPETSYGQEDLLATTGDIEGASGSLVGPLVPDQTGRAGEDQEFSRRTRRIGSQNVYTAALLESPASRGLHRGSASGSAL